MATWKELWQTWDLRVVILLSLLLQTFLIFSAPLRKRMSKAYIVMPMWLAYLLADATANYAAGIISKNQRQTSGAGGSSRATNYDTADLMTFWAPFLLVHLGGPDTITAFALEDNELWLRHLLGLGFQCWAVAYAFYLSFPNKNLWLPTVLMFIAGLIKYTERTRSLYLASARRFRESLLTEPDPGPNYAKLMDEYSSKIKARLPTKIEMIQEPDRVIKTENKEDAKPLTDLEVVQHAYKFFDTFKGLIADLIFSFRERTQSRNFFLKRTPRDAFKVVEVELNFIYEILYTKVAVVQGRFGYPLRFISFSLNWAALVYFYLMKKGEFEKFDIGITYTLLLGAIALDAIAFLMGLYSDWTAVVLTKSDYKFSLTKFFQKRLQKLLRVARKRWPEKSAKARSLSFGIMPIVRRRWSESISQYNFIHYCLKPRPKAWEKIIGVFGLTNMLDGLKYVKTEKFTNDLRDFIFDELKMKSAVADDLDTAKEINSARGDWILRFEGCTELLPWINEVDYDESLLLWHIATELCYNTDEDTVTDSKDRELSKQLSDYMLYLLIMQSTMLSAVAGIGQIRFRDTCAEAKKFFSGRNIGKVEEDKNCCQNIFDLVKCSCCSCCEAKTEPDDEVHKRACKSILDVNTAVKPVAVKGDRSKSVLFDASMLAKELKELKGERKWVVISKVWVELLSYAACRCRAYTHAAQLSKGGQLITLVWLLMSHLGLGNQFQISEGHARAKLIVGK